VNREAAFVGAFEHLFELGCHIPNVEWVNLAPNKRIYRALYIFPFHPPFVIDIFSSLDVAEIHFHIENGGFLWPWLRDIIAAFENDLKPSDHLPESYTFRTTKAHLSSAQLQWFNEQIARLPYDVFKSDAPETACERDGSSLRGRIATVSSRYCFDMWNCSHRDRDKDIERYFLSIYQLACSTFSDAENKSALMEMQRYFYGLKIDIQKDFVFPLIPSG
jgi:hypothetical protein